MIGVIAMLWNPSFEINNDKNINSPQSEMAHIFNKDDIELWKQNPLYASKMRKKTTIKSYSMFVLLEQEKPSNKYCNGETWQRSKKKMVKKNMPILSFIEIFLLKK